MKYYYAPDIDEWIVFTEAEIKQIMREEGLTELNAFEVVQPYYDKDYFHCAYFQEVRTKDACSIGCKGYTPRNRVSGVCAHYSNKFYRKGKKVKLSCS